MSLEQTRELGRHQGPGGDRAIGESRENAARSVASDQHCDGTNVAEGFQTRWGVQNVPIGPVPVYAMEEVATREDLIAVTREPQRIPLVAWIRESRWAAQPPNLEPVNIWVDARAENRLTVATPDHCPGLTQVTEESPDLSESLDVPNANRAIGRARRNGTTIR